MPENVVVFEPVGMIASNGTVKITYPVVHVTAVCLTASIILYRPTDVCPLNFTALLRVQVSSKMAINFPHNIFIVYKNMLKPHVAKEFGWVSS